ncbi:MAG: FeS-binding protein [SAR202 cluster bacterium]|jgi:ABC-type methionine transport system ATPase subunit|nr:FeS-binding protein [Chloroflexota bacterium]MQG02780.1 FeS-binding protein [SAR202 cluster bacterium]PKB65439.1 MAG: FeS-binding protein [SAR202 cluster bacterium Io17-Chloro-G3]HAE33221.1 FeS-binding protein [Dehalococcoidia bacterium]|tara:strand:- start:359 stop:601 length:243 start_codon:yes stop_codon:yes gene_type:complete
MATKRVRFTFPQGLIKQPVIYQLGQDFEVVTNIRRADVRDDMGWVVLELEGEDKVIDDSLKWVISTGVRVDPVGGDIIEG